MYRENSGIKKFDASEREGLSHFTVENFLSHSIEKFRWGILRCIGKYRLSKRFKHQGGRGYHISPSKTFCHTLSKSFVGEHFGVSGNFGYQKNFCIREGGVITFLRQNLSVTQYQKISLGNTSVYQKISDIETFYASERGSGGEYHVSPSKTFCHTVPKNFVGEHFGVSEKFGYRKNLCIREGGGITFPRRKLFVTQCRKISLGNTPVYRETSGVEKFCASEREGVSHFSVENFLSHSTKKFRWGTLRCIRKIRVSKNVMHHRGGGYHISQSKTSCHTVPKIVFGERFVESGILGIEKFYASEREGVSRFSVEKFLSHSIKKFRWGTLRCIRKIRISKYFMPRRERERGGDYHVSPSKTFCLTVPIKFVGEHFCVSKDFWYRIFEAKEGEALKFC